MTDANRCPICGSERPERGPQGLCPRCLMQQALDTETPIAAGASVLALLGTTVNPVPRVLLRDDTASGEPPSPVVQPSSPEMPDLPDRSARMQLFGEIARGGMGAILRGRDIDLGRDLAVKVLLEAHREKPELVKRFVEEAQIGGQLQHPGVVPVYELGAFADHRPFFTMKLVKGRTLAELLRERDAWQEPSPVGAGSVRRSGGPRRGTEPPPTEARPVVTLDDLPRFLGIFAQVCQTMAYAHARGVIHRDLKPSNVMVGSFGEVQVMDWGLAKVLPRGGVADEAGQESVHQTVIATVRSGSDGEHSQAGSVMGTPAYMAPEQARGEIGLVDERADVFALGSILCEVLTGQAAFTGRSPGEIRRKAALGDLADAHARIDACGADVELTALAREALAREREDRPRDAAALAGRVTAYLAGVQERLRQAELARARADARAQEERKRRKLALALAAAVVALMAVGGTGAAVYWQQRQAQSARLAVALRDVELLRDQARSDPEGDPARWRAAVAAAERAADLLGPLVDPRSRRDVQGLRDEIRKAADAADLDATLLRAMVDIRSAEADDPDGSASDADYAAAFRRAGLDVDTLGPDAVGARIRARPPGVVRAVAAALDDWASRRRMARPGDEVGWGRLIAAARAADRDETRDRLRDLWARPDRKAQRQPLLELAGRADPRAWPPATLILLADALDSADGADAALDLLHRAQAYHPGDVWLSFGLAARLEAMHPPRTEEAIGFYRAARALRPETAHGLAHLLERRGRGEEAVAVFQDLVRLREGNGRHWGCYGQLLKDRGDRAGAGAALEKAVAALRAAIRLRPDDAEAHSNLGHALRDQGKPDEAVAECRAAIRLRPDDAGAHYNLGLALCGQGKPDEAVAEYREAIRIKPDFASAHSSLGAILCDVKHDYIGAEAEFREAIRLRPDDAEAHSNLGHALRGQGKPAEAVAEYRAAIRLRPDDADAHNYLGLALRGQGKPAEAIAEYREAIRLRPDYAWAHTNLGLVLSGQGKPAEAVAEYREAIRLRPDLAEAHCNLGLVLPQQGQFREALDELRKGHELGSKRPDWRFPSAEWVRQAERQVALESRLPAVIRGDDQPRDGAEGTALADIAYSLKRYRASARLYAGAFRADPGLAQDMNSGHRYNAACATALAGAGRGEDPVTDEAEKARWRKQAVAWLEADLAYWGKQAEGGNAGSKGIIVQKLRHWKEDADLAGLRDESTVRALPDDERKACRALWAEVDALLGKLQGP